MPMITVFAFVDCEFWCTVIIGGNLCRKLGFFFRVVTDLMQVTDPAALWLVNVVRV